MEKEFKKSKTTFGQRFSRGWVLASFSVILLFFSFAFPQFALAQSFTCDAGSTVDADKDGVPAPGGPLYSQLSPCTDNYPDCNDADQWSHRYGSKDIASVKVEYAPAYVTKMQTEKKFTPDSKKFNPLLGNFLVTVTFKAKKCGVTANSIFMPMKVYYTTKDSSGNEVSIGLQLLADTGSITASDNLVRVSDLVYRGSIPGINFLTSDIEPYIASIAAGRPVQLKFIGPDIGPNKDTPKYQPLPMTNCAQVYGRGKHKVVYMRGQSSGFNAQNLLAQANKDVSGFNTIEPIKSNNSQLSHFVDLKNHNDNWPIVTSVLPSLCKSSNASTNQFFQDDRPDTPQTISSCGRFASYYYFHHAKLPGAYSDGGNLPGTLYVSVLPPEGKSQESSYLTPEVAVHEFAHAFGHLEDEYFICDPKDLARDPYPTDYHNNCSIDPLADWARGIKLSQFGVYAQAYPGCSFQQSRSGRYTYRPSSNSIMNTNYSDYPFYNMFNAVSCGWLLKKFKGGLARDYLNTCAAMPGIIPVGK